MASRRATVPAGARRPTRLQRAANRAVGAPPVPVPFPPNVFPVPPKVDPFPPKVVPFPPKVVPFPPKVDPVPPNVDPVPPKGDPVPPKGDPAPPGTPRRPVTLKMEALAPIVVAAARQASGVGEAARAAVVVWAEGADELMIDAGNVTVDTDEGLVRVVIPVSCDQTGDTKVRVTLAVGSPKQPAGMIAAAGRVPEGPTVVVSRWGDSLVALAWSVVVAATNAVAAAVGVDTLGAPLVAGEMMAERGALTVVPFARHRFGGESS